MSDQDEYREEKAKKEPEADSIEQLSEEEWYIKLTKIKGIGKETAKDIGRAFPSKDALIGALKDDLAPFRNDIVKKLKKYFQLNKQEDK